MNPLEGFNSLLNFKLLIKLHDLFVAQTERANRRRGAAHRERVRARVSAVDGAPADQGGQLARGVAHRQVRRVHHQQAVSM